MRDIIKTTKSDIRWKRPDNIKTSIKFKIKAAFAFNLFIWKKRECLKPERNFTQNCTFKQVCVYTLNLITLIITQANMT